MLEGPFSRVLLSANLWTQMRLTSSPQQLLQLALEVVVAKELYIIQLRAQNLRFYNLVWYFLQSHHVATPDDICYRPSASKDNCKGDTAGKLVAQFDAYPVYTHDPLSINPPFTTSVEFTLHEFKVQ